MQHNVLVRFFQITTAVIILSLVSCGGDNSNNVRQQQEVSDGIYRASFTPLNSNVAGNTTGSITIQITDNEFIISQSVTGSPAGVKHLQAIHGPGPCPTLSADLNGDGFIDPAEGMNSYGLMLIPLDSDLNSQIDGSEFAPMANGAGSFTYRRRASLDRLLTDLRDEDHDPADAMAKLASNENLNLAGRTVIIYGVSKSRGLPDTVASLGTLPVHDGLPIACGVLSRISPEEAADESSSEMNAYLQEDIEDAIDYGT